MWFGVVLVRWMLLFGSLVIGLRVVVRCGFRVLSWRWICWMLVSKVWVFVDLCLVWFFICLCWWISWCSFVCCLSIFFRLVWRMVFFVLLVMVKVIFLWIVVLSRWLGRVLGSLWNSVLRFGVCCWFMFLKKFFMVWLMFRVNVGLSVVWVLLVSVWVVFGKLLRVGSLFSFSELCCCVYFFSLES